MQALSSIKNYKEKVYVCRKCDVHGEPLVSHSKANPGEVYWKCPMCGKFLRWDEDTKKTSDERMAENINGMKMMAITDRPVMEDMKEMKIFLRSLLIEMGMKFMLLFGLPVVFMMVITIVLLFVIMNKFSL